MQTVLDYKCPNCGGKVEFESGIQQMQCPYCDSTFDVESLKEMDRVLQNETEQEEMKWNTAGEEWSEDEAAQMQVFVCNSCGGELVTDGNTAATHCPYCGNPVVLAGRLSGALKPDLVIPFKLDKEAAKEALKKHCQGKKLLPKSFYAENRLEEIKGIYVPFWLFDAEVDADLRYHATKVRRWSDSRNNYTETRHYSILRGGSLGFQAVPVDGSSKMADDLMESIEPFDLSQAVDFQTAYLSGYLADKYDVDAEQSVARANERIKQSTIDTFRDTVEGYATVVPEHSNLHLENAKAKYALYPVWLLTSKWKGETFTFAMNGQTGKFVGDLPMDKAAYWRWWAIWSAVLSVAAYGGYHLLKLLDIL